MMKTILDVVRALRDMDALLVERNPLPDHFASRKDEHCRTLYATLLAAVLLASDEVSENESRLFTLLLGALKLEGGPAKYFELAHAVDKLALREFLRLVDEHDLGHSFFVDALVLGRLGGALSDAQGRLLSHWVDLLGLPVEDLPYYAHVACLTLGLPSSVELPDFWDDRPYVVWTEWAGPKRLTKDVLMAGVDGGRWKIDEPLDMTVGWSIRNAFVRFENGAVIRTVAKEGQIILERCSLENPLIVAEGLKTTDAHRNPAFILKNVTVEGEYRDDSKSTVFVFSQISGVLVEECYFHARGARVINSVSMGGGYNYISVRDSVFEDCGNSKLKGGALFAYCFSIERCQFIDCLAAVGGGIMCVGYLNGSKPNSSIVYSIFRNCRSMQYASDDNKWEFGGALFSTVIIGVKNSFFYSANVYMPGESNGGMLNCNFIESNWYGVYSSYVSSSNHFERCDYGDRHPYNNEYASGERSAHERWWGSVLDDDVTDYQEKPWNSVC